jgi:hypothetical protein
MRFLWFLLPVFVILGGSAVIVLLARRKPPLTTEEIQERRFQGRRDWYTTQAVKMLLIAPVVGIALIVAGHWLPGGLLLVAGLAVAALCWQRRSPDPS